MAEFKLAVELTESELADVANILPPIRMEAARKGLAPDLLAHDENDNVRREVARLGWRTSMFLRDESPLVRAAAVAVAVEDEAVKLTADPDPAVRIAVARRGLSHEELATDGNMAVRRAVAETGYRPDIMAADAAPEVRQAVALNGMCLGALVDDPEPMVRAAVARAGYGLQELISDPSPEVRKEVASLGYGARQLVHDASAMVRIALAHAGCGLKTLICDKVAQVRAAVASKGYGLSRLIGDKAAVVRMAVAEAGYGLSRLMLDEDPRVREAAMRKQVEDLEQKLDEMSSALNRYTGLDMGNRSRKTFELDLSGMAEEAPEEVEEAALIAAQPESSEVSTTLVRDALTPGKSKLVIAYDDTPEAATAASRAYDAACDAYLMLAPENAIAGAGHRSEKLTVGVPRRAVSAPVAETVVKRPSAEKNDPFERVRNPGAAKPKVAQAVDRPARAPSPPATREGAKAHEGKGR